MGIYYNERIRIPASLALVWAAATWLSSPSYAQYPDDFHSFTLEAQAGRAGLGGADGKNFGSFLVYGGGIGRSLLNPPDKVRYQDADLSQPQYRHWNLFVTGDILYGSSKLKSPISDIISSNPQIPSLLSATGGSASFYVATGGPRFLYSWRYVSVYGQAEGGLLRRSLDLTGVSTEGPVLQPSAPSVYSQAGNSAAFRWRAGFAVGAKGIHGFGEIGMVQGFGVNNETRLIPIVSGGIRW